MLRRTVSLPVCLGIKHQSGAYDQTFAGLLMWGALSDERTGVWFTTAGPRQRLFSGPSRVGLVAIFYCLRLVTYLSVASYN
jgi:hypothetical protein